MKKNAKGFTLLETLIVSTVVVGTLIYLFTQISNVKTNYDISFRYNTIPGLFSAKNVVEYLKDSGYSTLISSLDNSSNEFIELDTAGLLNNGNNLYYQKLKEETNIKKVLFVKDDISGLKDKINECYDSDSTNNTLICSEEEEMKNFIRNLSTDSFPNTYRVIIEYNDLTFASIEIG